MHTVHCLGEKAAQHPARHAQTQIHRRPPRPTCAAGPCMRRPALAASRRALATAGREEALVCLDLDQQHQSPCERSPPTRPVPQALLPSSGAGPFASPSPPHAAVALAFSRSQLPSPAPASTFLHRPPPRARPRRPPPPARPPRPPAVGSRCPPAMRSPSVSPSPLALCARRPCAPHACRLCLCLRTHVNAQSIERNRLARRVRPTSRQRAPAADKSGPQPHSAEHAHTSCFYERHRVEPRTRQHGQHACTRTGGLGSAGGHGRW